MTATNPVAGGLTSFDIKIDGKSVDALILVARIDVLTSFSDPGRAMITLQANQAGGGSAVGGEDFPIGARLSVALGYDGQTSTAFTGTIDALGVCASPTEAARLQVEALEDLAQRPSPGSQSVEVLTYGATILNMDLTRTGSSGVGGEVQTMGTTRVRPGDVVTLAGLGPTFNGDGRVNALHHKIEAGHWTTTLQLGRPAPSADPS